MYQEKEKKKRTTKRKTEIRTGILMLLAIVFTVFGLPETVYADEHADTAIVSPTSTSVPSSAPSSEPSKSSEKVSDSDNH
jgi:hypothetical protein